jgi:aryl-alcohol dehydrogenase-like predicted oxidoreductase
MWMRRLGGRKAGARGLGTAGLSVAAIRRHRDQTLQHLRVERIDHAPPDLQAPLVETMGAFEELERLAG